MESLDPCNWSDDTRHLTLVVKFSSRASLWPFRGLKSQADAEAGTWTGANTALNQRTFRAQLMRLKHLMNDRWLKLHFIWMSAFVHGCPKAQAHQDAVKVISSHISSRSWQQGPRLSFVVCDKTLNMIVHQFIGKIHAVYPLNLRKKMPKINKERKFQNIYTFYCV